jgi:hypothetical protein
MAVSGERFGFIETRGFSAVSKPADNMLKAASVSLSGYRKTGSGFIGLWYVAMSGRGKRPWKRVPRQHRSREVV